MSEQTEVMVVEAEYVQLGSVKVSSPADVVRRAADIASELANVIKSQRLSSRIKGKDFVRVEGWSTLGAMLGVLPREVPGSVIRHEDGAYEATVELIRTTDGAVIGRGSAICGMDEEWGKRKEYARRSMAITRATGKAYRLAFSWIMTLAGYEPTPAEEMDGVVVEPKPKQQKKQSSPQQKNKDNGDEKWYQFVGRAQKELNYNHANHVENTLRKMTEQPDKEFWNRETGDLIGNSDDLWTLLNDHQKAKERAN